ncbi:MAG: serine/threonine protein kinase [Candidatus Marinamargulisbacteria bacterium]|jgi:serine/threonine protein kinase
MKQSLYKYISMGRSRRRGCVHVTFSAPSLEERMAAESRLATYSMGLVNIDSQELILGPTVYKLNRSAYCNEGRIHWVEAPDGQKLVIKEGYIAKESTELGDVTQVACDTLDWFQTLIDAPQEGLVTPYKVGTTLGPDRVSHYSWFLAMEACDGDLFDRIESGRLSTSETHGVATEVLAGLAFLETQGKCFSDLKPANVFIKDGRCMLGDIDACLDFDHAKNTDLEDLITLIYKCLTGTLSSLGASQHERELAELYETLVQSKDEDEQRLGQLVSLIQKQMDGTKSPGAILRACESLPN